jgi:hypothetical protein
MSNFTEALTKQMQRLSLVKAQAIEDKNVAAYEALVRADKVLELLKPYLGREGQVAGYTEHTPGCFQQIYATIIAVEDRKTLAQARGDGRLSTVVQNIRSTGNGFRNSVRQIEQFLGIEHAKLEHVKAGDFDATLPEVTDLLTSGSYYELMKESLRSRQDRIDSGEKLSKEEREHLLIGDRWDATKIVEYTTEYIARAFARRMDSQERKSLISGDATFATALDSIGLIKQLPAYA